MVGSSTSTRGWPSLPLTTKGFLVTGGLTSSYADALRMAPSLARLDRALDERGRALIWLVADALGLLLDSVKAVNRLKSFELQPVRCFENTPSTYVRHVVFAMATLVSCSWNAGGH